MTASERETGADADTGPQTVTPDLRRTAPTTDRGISPIAGRFGGRSSRLIPFAALGLGCGIFLFATWDRGDDTVRPATGGEEPARQVVPFEPARRPTGAVDLPPRLSADAPDDAVPALVAPDEPVPALQAPPAEAPSRGPSASEQRLALAQSAQRSPVLAYSRTSTPRVGQAVPVDPAAELAAGSGAPGSAGPTPLATLRQTSAIGQATARQLPDRHLLLTAGATLPCILQTAMDSTTPGYVSCVLPSDVYSESGSVVLMERGTRVLGEYQGGLQQGRSRLFVLWTRAVTPSGVAIDLASPASDALGRAGFDGTVDTRFWDRFGGALLLSFVDGGLYAAAGQDDRVRSTARVPSDAASAALQNTVDIPATLRKAQGSELSIFVAKDLNFASVYRLAAR